MAVQILSHYIQGHPKEVEALAASTLLGDGPPATTWDVVDKLHRHICYTRATGKTPFKYFEVLLQNVWDKIRHPTDTIGIETLRYIYEMKGKR